MRTVRQRRQGGAGEPVEAGGRGARARVGLGMGEAQQFLGGKRSGVPNLVAQLGGVDRDPVDRQQSRQRNQTAFDVTGRGFGGAAKSGFGQWGGHGLVSLRDECGVPVVPGTGILGEWVATGGAGSAEWVADTIAGLSAPSGGCSSPGVSDEGALAESIVRIAPSHGRAPRRAARAKLSDGS